MVGMASGESSKLVPFPDSLADTGKSLPTVDSSLRGNDGQVKRVSGIRHIQVETVLGLMGKELVHLLRKFYHVVNAVLHAPSLEAVLVKVFV